MTEQPPDRLWIREDWGGSWSVEPDPGNVDDDFWPYMPVSVHEAEVRCLGQWKCEKCGCRFDVEPLGSPAVLDGVTHCSACANGIALQAEVERHAAKCDMLQARVEDLEAEVERLRGEARDRMEMADAMAHVTIESGFTPGVDAPCRCEGCRLVCRKMDEAGYLECVKDRWWMEDAALSPQAGEEEE